MSRRGSTADLVRLLLGHLSRFRGRTLQDVATGALRAPDGDRAWVVGILNLTLRARRWLHYRLVLEPRRLRSRLLFRRPDPAGPRRTISLLCPTRDRVAQVARMVSSVARTAAEPDRVEVLCYVDSDDPALPGYRELFAGRRFGGVRCVLLVGEPVGVPAAWNRLAAGAGGDVLLMANDDQLYVDHGWDVTLDARLTALETGHPDGLLCLYFDAGQYPDGGRDFPIVTRRWYEALGYFVPTAFSQWEVETWVFDVAERAGRLYPVSGVFVEHLHYQDYKAPFDATYQRHRLTREKSFADHALFLRTGSVRAAEADRLRAVVRGGTGTVPATGFWFAGFLAEHRDRMAAEVAAWSAGSEPADGTRRVVLFADGAWTGTAGETLPVLVDVLLAVPEATVPSGSRVELVLLGPGAATVPDPGIRDATVSVCLGLHVPEPARPRVGAVPVDWRPGDCLVFPGDTVPIIRNDGAGTLAALLFSVPDPDRVPAPANAEAVTGNA
ncbi:aspartyl/asparaginyl beta-hydroxylase domain-containing protein [Plantactinospora sp. KLBMP9567]|uniref:aspartyl/asparaginyl beta-hydroxylase domain-containing protein n=1 Tax=Plantactinospora sp. KLBMP9567 TaxID=3085900 RepID=UPI002980DFAA|nr:aspartyl/asparaginyl beta-hydroxylase domain-containing protein [Plantactinospora sp. KLBMP9567]MDW5324852.1 aspartyl/asparaginyl beta-hydroxylase domain-containing protein [Plantactinospora sp. KLBMP9567]